MAFSNFCVFIFVDGHVLPLHKSQIQSFVGVNGFQSTNTVNTKPCKIKVHTVLLLELIVNNLGT